MTDRDIRERMHAGRAGMPPGFDARQDALLMRLVAGQAPARRTAPIKRPFALALAVSLLLLGGVAGATGSLSLARFWREANPEGERLVQSGIAQTGGETDGASFAVREAVLDGTTLEALIEVRGKEGFTPLEENSDELLALLGETDWAKSPEAERTLAVGCGTTSVDGTTLSVGGGASMIEEDGTLLIYVRDVLEDAVQTENARITMACWAHPANDPQGRQKAELSFTLPVVERETAACAMNADMEGWLTVTRVEASYTPLSMEADITYTPGERLKRAMPVFEIEDGDREAFWGEIVGRTENDDGSYTVRLVCPRAHSMPGALTLRVNGLDSALAIDFAAGTAAVTRETEEE